MDSLFWNKIFGAVLATALVIFGIRELSHVLVHSEVPETPGYAIAIESTGNATKTVEAVKEPSLSELLASASASSGERVAKKCGACHSFDKGGANKIGPNLWGTVGNAAASHDGFKYSSAMAASGLTWDFETLNRFLTKPSALVSGTAMGFAGLKKPADRANLMAWMNAKSDAPIAMPSLAAPVEAAPAQPVIEAVTQAAEDMADKLPGASDASDAIKQAVEEVKTDVSGGDH